MKLKHVACELCGSDGGELLFRGRDRLHDVAGTFCVLRCRQCGLVYLNPRPVDLTPYYPLDAYAPYSLGSAHRHFAIGLWRQEGVRRKCQAVAKVRKGGALLDVGCAGGEFLSQMGKFGEWALKGLEINEEMARQARETLNLDVMVGQLPDERLATASFDVVTMWHVLEHMHSPRAALQEVHRILRDDGLLVVSCPMLDSVEAKLFGPFWAGFDVPRHLYTFSRSTLAQLLANAGFDVVEAEGVILGLNSLRISLMFWLREKLGDLSKGPRLVEVIRTLMLGPLFAAVLSSSRFTKRLAVSTFYATKRQARPSVEVNGTTNHIATAIGV